MKRSSKSRKKAAKPRNWFAMHAFQRSGAGHHGDKKKERSKNACRKWKENRGSCTATI